MHKLFWALVVVCALLVAADLFYRKHVHFGWESWFGFYGIYGFACFFLLVLAGKSRPRRKIEPDNRRQ